MNPLPNINADAKTSVSDSCNSSCCMPVKKKKHHHRKHSDHSSTEKKTDDLSKEKLSKSVEKSEKK